MERFRGGLVFKAHRILYYSTLGLRVIKKRRRGAQAARRRLQASVSGGNGLNGFTDFHTENGSGQGQDLALTVLFVPVSLDSGKLVGSAR